MENKRLSVAIANKKAIFEAVAQKPERMVEARKPGKLNPNALTAIDRIGKPGTTPPPVVNSVPVEEDSSRPRIGLIILGNSGVGKSYIANVTLGAQKFKHAFIARSVTAETEMKELSIPGYIIEVFNIPGLVENDASLIARNKAEIGKAFELRPVSIICYVFSVQGGRIRDEDVVAFHALNSAYKLDLESLCFIVNDLPAIRGENYEGETSLRISELLSIPLDKLRVRFCDRLSPNDNAGQEKMRKKLIDMFVECVPKPHVKHQEILLFRDQIDNLKQDIANRQTAFDNAIHAYQSQISSLQAQYDDLKRQPPKEIHIYHERIVERGGGGGCCII